MIFRAIAVLILCSLPAFARAECCIGEDGGPIGIVTSQEIINALTFSTRGGMVPKIGNAEQDFLDDLPAVTRSITVEERNEISNVVTTYALPSLDLEIYFDYNSADLSPKAMPALAALGEALRNPALAGQNFLLFGHTDAKGSDEYNLALSQKRAESVKAFLASAFSIPSLTLAAIGFGEEQLKLPDQPEAEQNRRVTVVRMQQ